MATPPTFVAEYESVFNTTTTPKTASVTTSVGDVLVVCAVSEESSGFNFNTPTGGTSLTWTLAQNVAVDTYTEVSVWTATATTAESFTLSVTTNGSGLLWGFNCLRFSGSDGPGASSKTNVSSGGPSLALTTGTDDAAIVCVSGDWNAADGTSRTWRTINSITPTAGNNLERTYFRDSAHYALYIGYWNDAGTAGSKTTGLSAPTGQKYAIASVEVKGSGGTGATVTPSTVAAAAAVPSASPSTGSTVTPGPVATGASVPAATVRISSNITPNPVAAGAAVPATAVAVGSTVSPSPVTATAAVPAASVTAGGSATISAAPVVAVTAVPSAVLSTGSTVLSATVAATTAVLSPVPSGGALATPNRVAATATVPGPTPSGGATVTPVPVAAVASCPPPTVAGTSGALVLAARVAATATVWPVTVNPTGLIPRPNTGTTTRPATGTITRPFTGIITRP